MKLEQQIWWKLLSILLILYSIIAGLLLPVPARDILNETIRNLYYHVPMWFSMMVVGAISLYHSIKYLGTNNIKHDIKASNALGVAVFLGIIGLLTGMVWARFTWGTFWTRDPKLNGVAASLLMFSGYFVLRNGSKDIYKTARLSAVVNIVAYVMFIVFIMILPRLMDSLHPGNGGNPAFSKYDLDHTMRLVFYPAVLGWILMGIWLYSLKSRTEIIEKKEIIDDDNDKIINHLVQ
jgi:heme exporter protein C